MIDQLAVVMPLTKRSRARIEYFAQALRKIEADQIVGDIVECGVWRGASIVLSRMLCPARVCWLFDTFDGMTAPDPVLDISLNFRRAADSYVSKQRNGRKWAAASQQEVEDNLRDCGLLDPDKLRFVPGRVEDTLQGDDLPAAIALLHLDTDWHASTAIELRTLFPRLVTGGILIVDDYGHWLGARKAVDDYFAGRGVSFQQIDYTAVALVKQ